MDPKPINDKIIQAWAWLSALKCYFIIIGITCIATKAADAEAACQYAMALMGGNAAR